MDWHVWKFHLEIEFDAQLLDQTSQELIKRNFSILLLYHKYCFGGVAKEDKELCVT